MKVLAVLLLASYALAHQSQKSDWHQFYNWAVTKAMESCLGKENVNKYTVNMKKAVAKCHQEDAPELNLPPYRSMYKFVNTIINGADQMDQEKLQQMFIMMKMMNNNEGNHHFDNYESRNDYHDRHSGYEWLQEKWMKYKMQKMIQHILNEDDFSAHTYSFDNKMDKFDMNNDNKMDKFQMMKMMKEVMMKNNHNSEMDKYKMMRLMKEFFGNEYSMDQYEMMEKFFRNKNDMDSFEMMKMMMKFNEKEKSMDMFEMMKMMEKMYGNDYKGNRFNSNHFDKDYKLPPVEAQFRFRREASENTKPTDLTKPAPGLDRGDRLYAKLEEQKKYMESYVGNLTCVLREVNVLNKENEIDVPALKKSLQQYTMPSPWFKKRYEELIDVCYETAVNLPAAIVEEYKVKGEFGEVNLAHVKQFTKCCTEGKQRLCMNQDTKNKIESNFGPIKAILDETKLTEYQLFPLVLQMLQGEESEYLGETYYG